MVCLDSWTILRGWMARTRRRSPRREERFSALRVSVYAVPMKRDPCRSGEAEIPRWTVLRAARGIGPLCVGFTLALAVSGCGSGGGKSASAATHAMTRTSSSTRAPVRSLMPHLSILSPRQGARTGQTLTVRVTVSNAPAGGARRFRYVLDRRLRRSGSSRLTFQNLAPGRHHLLVFMTTGGAHASTTFTVRAPAPQVAVQAPPTEVQRTTSAPTTAAPPPAKAAPPPPKSTSSPPAGGIPQGPNAGDGDGDNQGAPSDGDGNV
jgi:hypothetical protein